MVCGFSSDEYDEWPMKNDGHKFNCPNTILCIASAVKLSIFVIMLSLGAEFSMCVVLFALVSFWITS